MKCTRCGKQALENEYFCEDCKRELKKASSREEVSELETLIKETRELNDLENTKELKNLSDMVSEELEQTKMLESEDISTAELDNTLEQTKIEEINLPEEKKEKPLTREEFHKEEKEDKPKKSKKKKILIISIISLIVLLGIGITVYIFTNKEESLTSKIDYEKVINEYGKIITKQAKKMYEETNEVPTWKDVLENINYKKYDISCSVHEIYEDGIYLDKCKIDGKKVKNKYGKKQEVKENTGKKIPIYKTTRDGYTYYSETKIEGYEFVSEIICKTDTCNFINAYDKYIIIKENNEYYIYDYTNNSLTFGPFVLESENIDILFNGSTLYGIIYRENGKYNIYSLNTNKVFKDIKGTRFVGDLSCDSSTMLKYNYVIMRNNNKYDFVNLNTGNVSYTINNSIGLILEDIKNKNVYITAYTKDYNTFKVYSGKGKLLFNGEEFNDIRLTDKNIIVSTHEYFKVYDSKLSLQKASKKYKTLFGMYEEYAVVLESNNIKIVDLNDNTLVKFDLDWDKGNYKFINELSGVYEENNKKTIYVVIENLDVPSGTKGRGLKYYYIPSTKESGVIELNNIW